MVKTPTRLVTYLSLILLSGCATLGADDCRTADWEQLGEDDADRGRQAGYFENHVEACAAHGITPDRDAYFSGYEAGLDDYCSVRGGITAGRNGQTYQDVCIEETETDFLKGYSRGRRIYQAEADIREYSALIRQYQYEIQFNPNLSQELRRRYVTDVIRLEQKLNRARGDVELYERQAEALLREDSPQPN